MTEDGFGPEPARDVVRGPADPVGLLQSLPAGTRVVIRMRIPGGFTDVLGDVESCTESDCLVRTRRGPIPVPLSTVVLAKRVPPPPSRPGEDRPRSFRDA